MLAAQIGGGGTPLEAAIDQTDTRLMVTITNGVNQERCAYEGTIAGDSITVSMTSCTPRVCWRSAPRAHRKETSASG